MLAYGVGRKGEHRKSGPECAGTRLVVLADHSDGVFLRNELGALAQAFDDVVVFNLVARDEYTSELLKNVRYAGSLAPGHRSRASIIWSMCSPRFLGVTARLAVRELRDGRLLRHFGEFLSACVLGAEIARHPAFRAELEKPEHTTVYGFWGVGASLCLPWLPARLVGRYVRLHSFDLYEWVRGYLPFRRGLFSELDGILVITRHGLDYLRTVYRGERFLDRAIVSRLGTTDRGLAPFNRRDRLTVVSCSNVVSEKRVERIPDALALIDGPVRWVHFGDGDCMDAVRRSVSQLAGVEVELRGHTPHDQVMQFLSTEAVDVFVNVSSREGAPVSIMEAMSFGVPVVATAVGGTPELLGGEPQSGMLIPADFTNQDLANAIQEVGESPRARFDPRAAWQQAWDAERNARNAANVISGVKPTD